MFPGTEWFAKAELWGFGWGVWKRFFSKCMDKIAARDWQWFFFFFHVRKFLLLGSVSYPIHWDIDNILRNFTESILRNRDKYLTLIFLYWASHYWFVNFQLLLNKIWKEFLPFSLAISQWSCKAYWIHLFLDLTWDLLNWETNSVTGWGMNLKCSCRNW